VSVRYNHAQLFFVIVGILPEKLKMFPKIKKTADVWC